MGHDLKSPRIAVVGCGAVGLFYGATLARAGHDVHFLMRSDFDSARERGIRITRESDPFVLAAPQIHKSAEEIGPCDFVLMGLKATANGILPSLLPALLKPGTILFGMQNGFGLEEVLIRHFPGHPLVRALCFVCLNRIQPAEVLHIGHGSLAIGAFTPEPFSLVESIAGMFEEAGITAKASPNLDEICWRKLAWNIPFNGLSVAAGGIDVQQILNHPQLRVLLRDLIQDVVQIARKIGHDIPDSFIDLQIEKTLPMGPYKPSSLLDFQEGRPLEVEAIWGEPYRRGLAAGGPVERLGMLYALLAKLNPAAN